jgi:hypothetical protein
MGEWVRLPHSPPFKGITMSYRNYVNFEVLKGLTLSEVDVSDSMIRFVTVDGEVYNMYHQQDCCESVTVESVVGDIEDLIGEEILVAEESSSCDNPEDADVSECQESFTWTFYKLATRKGYVDIRWYGESNGYYSESVSMYKV